MHNILQQQSLVSQGAVKKISLPFLLVNWAAAGLVDPHE